MRPTTENPTIMMNNDSLDSSKSSRKSRFRFPRLLLRSRSTNDPKCEVPSLTEADPWEHSEHPQMTRLRKACSLDTSKETSTNACTTTYSLDNALRTVSFGSITIREHGRVLVEHPECNDGLALGLDWKHAKRDVRIDVDLFERIRSTQGKRGGVRCKQLCTYDKKVLLMKVGGYKERTLWKAFRESYEGKQCPAA